MENPYENVGTADTQTSGATAQATTLPHPSPLPLRHCRRCLLMDLNGGEAAYESIQRLRRAMPAGEKAEDQEYERRLSICRDCPRLDNAVCMQCGCYAEVRALKRSAHCPEGRWK